MCDDIKKAFDISDPEERKRTLKDLISKMIEKDMAWIQEQNSLENVASGWALGLQKTIDKLGNIDTIVTPIVKDDKITLQLKMPYPIEGIAYPVKIVYYSKNKKRKNMRNKHPFRVKKVIEIPYDLYYTMLSSN